MIRIKNTSEIKIKIVLFIMIVFPIAGYIISHFTLTGALALGLMLLIILPLAYLVQKNVRYFEYEYSGEVVCIRTCNLLLKQKMQITEFPKEKLLGFEIDKATYTIELKIELQSDSKVKVIHYFTIIGLEEHDVLLLENSLQWILIEKTYN